MPPHNHFSISQKIQSKLNRLRGKIKRFVWLQGLAILVTWLLVAFLLTFLLDFVPVKMGLDELPVWMRALLLGTTAAAGVFLFYFYVGRKLFVPIKDKSLALLVERRYPEFGDSLVTTVETAALGSAAAIDPELFDTTQQNAVEKFKGVDLDNVLNWPRLNFWVSLAGLAIVSVGLFAFFAPETFQTATTRVYGLSADKWPRQNYLEIVGIRVKREEPVEGITEIGQVIPLKDGQFKVAKGASVTLMVKAKTESSDGRELELPEICEFKYWGDDGVRGTQRLKKIGSARDGKQLFSLDGGVLDGILKPLTFQIRGGDFRLGNYDIGVVDQPAVIRTDLDCNYPEYMIDEASSRYTARVVTWNNGTSLPAGTKLTVRGVTNKAIEKVYAISGDGMVESFPGTNDGFEMQIDSLDENLVTQFYLCDTDGVIAEAPHVVAIQSVQDQAPRVNTFLKGIGTAITPDAVLPIRGTVADDYDVQETWVEIDRSDSPTTKAGFGLKQDGEIATEIDFRAYRQDPNGFSINTEETQQVAVLVKANDFFGLGTEPNLGIGDQYVLDVVSPSELLKILEQLEVGQRRRFEQIFTEVADCRGYLVRTKSSPAETSDAGAEPGDKPIESAEPGDSAKSRDELISETELRLLFAQRATLQAEKSQGETKGLAEAFDDIRLQLINNRVDSQDRKSRLDDQVIGPLRNISGPIMDELIVRTRGLEDGLRLLQDKPEVEALAKSVDELSLAAMEQNDLVLAEMNKVLSILVKYETQNELLDIVRQMIEKQDEIMKRTKKERERKAFDGLLD